MLAGDFLTILTVGAVLTIVARLATGPIAALLTSFAIAVPAIAAVLVAITVAALASLLRGRIALALLIAGADRIAFVAIIVVAIEIELGRRLGTLLLVFEPAALISEHAEIMVRELQIIFGVDAIALALRVRREIFVLLEKLRCVAARAAIDPIAAVAASLAALALAIAAATTATAATTAPAAVLPIVNQAIVLVLRTKTGLAPASRCKPSGIAARDQAER